MRPFRHVGINAVFLRPMMGGIDTYVRRLVPELLQVEPGLRLTVFVSRHGRSELADEPWIDQVKLATHPLLGVRYLQAAAEMTLIGAMAARRGVDVLQSVALTGPVVAAPAHVVTLGDLTWLREPSAVDRPTRWTWKTVVPLIARRADRILTYSESSRRDIVELLSIPEEEIDVVALGPGQSKLPAALPEAEVRSALDLGEGPIVFTASVMRPTKNLRRLIEAMPAVVEQVGDATLVMSGPPTTHQQELAALAADSGLSDRIRFPGYVDAAVLEGLYRCASCFVVPSLYEGFGLPVLEAMRRRTPVACSRASSLPEVAGEAALYFDPLDPEAIAAAVIRLLTDPALAARLADEGFERQSRFSWRATAEGTMACFERAFAAREART